MSVQTIIKITALSVAGFCYNQAKAQTTDELLSEAKKLEQKYKEKEALEVYKKVLAVDGNNVPALLKVSEIHAAMGMRLTEPEHQAPYYKAAKEAVDKAFLIDKLNSDVLAEMSLVYSLNADIEKKKETTVDLIKQSKAFADLAVAQNDKNPKAYYALGKWCYDMENRNKLIKAAVKVFYGSFDKTNIDSTTAYLEKSITLDKYFAPGYYYLGKAYNYNRQYEKAVQVLQQLAKLPTLTQYYVDVKKLGADLYQQLQ
ncbi:tetratricopeptide repeat protein [Polluticaenibacter yanchengensis]|uniref:Tetratricopeptide repeat protein n=1 Tax=Polluticaenibacter yanchengensis TaxID=3014562 RepID=A0ABT4UM57_9BACT|nr:hypothetical protein [Chitinophagaceae bacterium LY-5]